MFELQQITAGYGATTVLRDVTLTVPAGSVVALLGPNGAGKTTLLRVASGLLRPGSGRILLDGAPLTGRGVDRLSRAGVCHVPEGRGVFPSLTVRENLRLQAPVGREAEALERAGDIFPVLRSRLDQVAGTMSGGEQQMLALARTYVCGPRVVLLDEVSMGLAPRVVDQIFEFLGRLRDEGISMLLVEQYVTRALALADYVYLLQRGRVAFAGEPAELDGDELFRRYLGGQPGRGPAGGAGRRPVRRETTMGKPKRSAAVLLAVTTLVVAGGCGTRRSLDDIRAGAGVDRPQTGATSLAGANTPSAAPVAADGTGGSGLASATGSASAASGARPSGGSGAIVDGAARPGASAGSGSSGQAAGVAGGGGVAAGPSGGAAPSRPGGDAPGATQSNSGATPVPNAGPRSPVMIGNVGTYTGPAGSSLADQPVGVQLWARWVNDRGGVNGHPVKVVVADDGGDPARHRALVQQLVETQGVIAFVGNGEVITGASSVDYLTQKGVAVIGNEGGSEWFYSSPTYFTQIPTGQTYWKAVASSVAEAGRAKNKSKWASITCTEATTCADADRTWNNDGEIKSVGLSPVYRARASIAQPDFTAECLNARNAGAEILTLVMDAASVQRVAASCARQDFRPLITEVASSSKTSHASDPNLSHGVVASIGHFSWTDASTPAAQEFQAAVKQYLGKEPAGAGLASAWASAKVFEKAAAHLGEPPAAAAVLDGLYAMQGETLGGLVMPLTFTRGKPAPRQVCWMTNLGEGGKWTPLNGGRISCR